LGDIRCPDPPYPIRRAGTCHDAQRKAWDARRDQLIRANADFVSLNLKFSRHIGVSRPGEGFAAGRDFASTERELTTGRLHVRRAKNGSPSVHPTQGDEIRALRRLHREQVLASHVFMTERDGPMTPKAFHALFGRIGKRAKMPFPVHPRTCDPCAVGAGGCSPIRLPPAMMR
jgi:hypothetical protein